MAKKSEKSSTSKDELQQQIAELTEDLQRVHADFVNFRRRNEEERRQLSEIAKTSVIKQLLPLIDNIERAVGHIPEELADNQWAKGVNQLAKQLNQSLKNIGVERIKTKNQPFDPHLHEAVSYDDDGEGEEIVVEELQAGYKMTDSDEVISHAMVRVGKQRDI